MTGLKRSPYKCMCGKRHRTYKALARCKYRKYTIHQEGPFATVARCARTIELWESLEKAQEAKELIDRFACGSQCRRSSYHEIHELSLERQTVQRAEGRKQMTGGNRL